MDRRRTWPAWPISSEDAVRVDVLPFDTSINVWVPIERSLVALQIRGVISGISRGTQISRSKDLLSLPVVA